MQNLIIYNAKCKIYNISMQNIYKIKMMKNRIYHEKHKHIMHKITRADNTDAVSTRKVAEP